MGYTKTDFYLLPLTQMDRYLVPVMLNYMASLCKSKVLALLLNILSSNMTDLKALMLKILAVKVGHG
jgi:hypothetical protein